MIEEVASARLRRGPFRLLPDFLFDAGHSKTLYVGKAWILSLLPSMALAALVTFSTENPPTPDFAGTGPAVYALLVLFAPVVETFLMVPPLLLMNRFFGPLAAAIGSALLWGVLHSLAVPLWGLVIWWPFLLFSIILLVWKEKSLSTAMVIVIAVHAMQNGVAGFSLLLA